MAAVWGRNRDQPYGTHVGYRYQAYGYGGYNNGYNNACYQCGGGRGHGNRGGFSGEHGFDQSDLDCDKNRVYGHGDDEVVNDDKLETVHTLANAMLSEFCTFRPKERRIGQDGPKDNQK